MSRQTAIRGLKPRLNHGIQIGAQLMDTHSESVAVAWFHEHEQLPLHSADHCLALPASDAAARGAATSPASRRGSVARRARASWRDAAPGAASR